MKKIILKKEVKEKLGKEKWRKVLSNKRKIDVYSFLYKSNGNEVRGFLVKPKKINSKLPCIIWNRGGSRDFGSIKIGHLFLNMADLTKQGYVVIASQYSGSPGSEGVDDWGGDNIADVLNLKKIINKLDYVDTKRIGMYGWSRGGMMTYRALSKVKWIKCAIIGAGPTDEVSAAKTRKGWRKHQISLYGKAKSEQIRRSALYWPEKLYKKTPILIMHGTADWRVSAKDSIRLSEKLVDEKVPHRLVIFEGGDHGLTEHREEVNRLTSEWFDRFLRKGEKLPNIKPHGD